MKLLLATACAVMVLLVTNLTASAAEPAKIAFVDTGNTGRSVTAEALADAMIAERKMPILVISRAVDLDPYYVVPEANAATLLRQKGLDVSAHRAAQLTSADVRHSDLLFTMTTKHKNAILEQFPDAKGKVFTISEYATGTPNDVVDAFGKDMPVYEQVFAQISGYLPTVLDKVALTVVAK